MADQNKQSGAPAPDSEQSATALLKEMDQLKRKVAEAERKKEAHLVGQIKEHDSLLAGIRESSSTIEGAEKNLAYFEEAKATGLLQGEDLAKFEELKKSLEELKKKREETRQKVASIYGQPEVGDRIHEAALKENEEFDLVAEGEKLFEEELPKALLGILEEAGAYIQSIADATEKAEKERSEMYKIIDNISNWVPQMKKEFSKKTPQTAEGYYYLLRQKEIRVEEFISLLANGVEELGFMRGSEKKALETFINSDAVVGLAKRERQGDEAWNEVNRIKNEGHKTEAQLKTKFGEEVLKKMEDYERKRKAFMEKTGKDIKNPRDGGRGGDNIFEAARTAWGQYTKKKERLSPQFKEKMSQLLSNLAINGGQRVFYHRFFE